MSVVVLHAPVPADEGTLLHLQEVLDPGERERAARFAFAKDRNLYITAHALLRYGLYRVAGLSDCRFRVDRFGKPSLIHTPSRPAVSFNLAHAGHLAACAIAYGNDVGIDVEPVDENFDFADIARRHFAPHEQAQLAALGPDDRRHAFYRLWTLKEAIIKAIGHGLSLPLQQFAFTLEPLSLQMSEKFAEPAGHWHIEQRQPEPRTWISLAVRRDPNADVTVEWQRVNAAEIAAASRDIRAPS